MRSTDEPPVRASAAEAAFARFFRDRYGVVLGFVVRRVADQELAREITARLVRKGGRSRAGGRGV